MSFQLTDSFEHKELVEDLRTDMDKILERELHPGECCIYRVHEMLCNINEKAYTPQMVSIGPFHHGNKRLVNMEKIKRSYMKKFLEQRITTEMQDAIFSYVKNKENEIRNCYSEISDLKSHKYTMMILYDAIFIIELFIRYFKKDASDLILSTAAVTYSLTLDLVLLLENQLPYFVLEEICELANMPSFMSISRGFFNSLTDWNLIELTPLHFTDWRRSTLLKRLGLPIDDWTMITLLKEYQILDLSVDDLMLNSGENFNKFRKRCTKFLKDLPCATKLHESGVKFKDGQGNPLFGKHEFQLPQLVITDGSECQLRNVMALEQCHYRTDTRLCNYIYLMDRLIDTKNDVDLLVESGIISNLIGDNSSLANLFNKLGRNIILSPSADYHDMCRELKRHCDSPRNKTMATLRRVYFSDLWRGTGTIAVVTLLLLTVIQTICSILQL